MRLLLTNIFIYITIALQAQSSILKENTVAYKDFLQGELYYIKGNYQAAIPLLKSAEEKYRNPNAVITANALHSLALLKNTEKEKAYFSFYNTGKTLLANQEGLKAEARLALNYCMSRLL